MMFSTPGHSCIQEVDNIHSNIEKSPRSFYPISLIRIKLRSKNKIPIKLYRCKQDTFWFSSTSN